MPSYHAAGPEALAIVPLDELTAVYHRPAGATHLLAEPAPQILALLQERASDLAELLARLGERFALETGAETAVAARLDELVAAGLVAAA